MPYKNKEDKQAWIEANRDKQNAYNKKHYDNSPAVIAKREDKEARKIRYELTKTEDKQRKIEYKRDKQQYYFNLFGGKCMSCGLVDEPIAYDYHHIDPTTKEYAVSNLFNTLSSNNIDYKNRIEKELSKCVLVCVICHRKIHAMLINCPTHTVVNFVGSSGSII